MRSLFAGTFKGTERIFAQRQRVAVVFAVFALVDVATLIAVAIKSGCGERYRNDFSANPGPT